VQQQTKQTKHVAQKSMWKKWIKNQTISLI